MTVEVIKLKNICHYWLCNEVHSKNYGVGGLPCEQRKRYPGLAARKNSKAQTFKCTSSPPPASTLWSQACHTVHFTFHVDKDIYYYLHYQSIQQLFYSGRAPRHCVMQPHDVAKKHFSCRQTMFCPATAALCFAQKSCQHFGAAALSPSISSEIHIL